MRSRAGARLYEAAVAACTPAHATDQQLVDQQAAAHGAAEQQRRLGPRAKLQRLEPEQQRDDQALVQHVPGIDRLGAVRQPAERAVEEDLAPAEDGQQRGPDVQRLAGPDLQVPERSGPLTQRRVGRQHLAEDAQAHVPADCGKRQPQHGAAQGDHSIPEHGLAAKQSPSRALVDG
ncbi:hypothetical protein G6F22_011850 [Rhizopus arrhizus]|nr:hypothetical protein G6F22_011850 [Rhizopus arrhizus]